MATESLFIKGMNMSNICELTIDLSMDLTDTKQPIISDTAMKKIKIDARMNTANSAKTKVKVYSNSSISH